MKKKINKFLKNNKISICFIIFVIVFELLTYVISHYFKKHIKSGRLECLTFNGNNKKERGKGYGKRMMLEGILAAQDCFGAKRIYIEAQEYARGFYEQVGFRQSSEPFILDGIPHIRMTWASEE